MNDVELSEFLDTLYEELGGISSPYANDFQYVIGGCHCIPQTEWYGDIFLALKKVLSEKAISNKEMVEKAECIVKHFSKWFS